MIRPRKSVQRIKKYRPPLEGRGGKMRLDFNENTVGCAPEVIRALRRAMDPDTLARYPEYEEGRKTLAEFFGVSTDEILLANGTDDAIKVICETFVDPNDVLLVPAPTFPVYQFFHEVAGGKTVRVPYDQTFHLPAEDVIRALKKRTRWLALGNPNNPTGTMVPKKSLKAILQAAPDVLVLVDEAYYDFAGDTVLSWIRKYPNLIVTRTFSKAFGLAALRLGCIFANAELTEAMHRGQNPFPVNSVALAGALEAIQHMDYVRRYVEEVRTNRVEFCRWLSSLGLPYVPSSSNFVLTRIGKQAPAVAQELRAQGILVRDWSYDPHLKGYLRFTMGSTAQTRRLIEELERLEPLIETRDKAGGWRNLTTRPSTGWFA